jgi:hypothetical protein
VGIERLPVLGRQQFDRGREKVERFPVCGHHLDRGRERVGSERLPVFGGQQFFGQGKITGRNVTSHGKITVGHGKIKGRKVTSLEKITVRH